MRSYDLALLLLPRNKREHYESVWLDEFENSNLNGTNRFTKLIQFASMALKLRWAQSSPFRWAVSLFAIVALVLVYAELMFLRNPILLFLFLLALKKLDFRAVSLKRSLMVTVVYLATVSITYLYSVALQSLRIAGYVAEGPFAQALSATGKVLIVLAILAMIASICLWVIEFLSYPDVFKGGKILGLPIALLAIGFWVYEGLHWLDVFEIDIVADQLLVQFSRIHQVTTNLIIPLMVIWLIVLAWTKLRRNKSERTHGSPVS